MTDEFQPAIQSAKDLYEWFHSCSKLSKARQVKELTKGIYVSSKIRNEVYVSCYQNKITIGGTVYPIKWQSCNTNVWRAYIFEEEIGVDYS